MTEKDCLEYCYRCGVEWRQQEIRLYDILDRVSCQQKNLKELRNIRKYLPELWDSFKTWQNQTAFPYRSDGTTVQDLDRRFDEEQKYVQMDLFDLGMEGGEAE